VVPEVGGRPAFTPGRTSTLVIAALLEIAASLVALQGKLFAIGGLPPALIRMGALGVALVLAARGVGDFRLVGLFKRVRGTRFARLDSRVYVPLCLALATGIDSSLAHARHLQVSADPTQQLARREWLQQVASWSTPTPD
jgi:Protein of unknown function (DUF3995)